MMWAWPSAFLMFLLVARAATSATESDIFFISEPTSRLVKLSDGRAVFRCNASPPSAEIRWLYKGQPVRHPKWIKASGHKLTVLLSRVDKGPRSAHQLENAYFQCEIKHKGKVLVSSPAKLIVSVLEQFPAQADVHIAVIFGNTAVIPCDPPHSVPTVVTEFKFNDTLISRSSDTHQLMPSGDLQIFNATYENSGEYTCIAHNPYLSEKVESKRKVILHVEETSVPKPPSFIKSPRSKLSVAFGNNITLECVASGSPVPRITWRKHHGKLHNSRHLQLSGNLHIISVRRSDEGTYYCDATNSVGSTSTSASVEIQETPQITRPPKSLVVEAGTNFTLNCTSRGHPRPVLSWIHNGRAVSSDVESRIKGSQLTVWNTNHKDSGIYQCFAKNVLGTVNSYAVVTVKSGNNSYDMDPDMYDDYDYTISTPTLYHEKKNTHGSDDQNRRHHNGGKTTPKKDSSLDFGLDSSKRTHKKKHQKGVKLVPPSRPEVTRLSNSSAMVRWGVPRNDGLPILFFKVQYKEVGRRSTDWMTIDEDIAAHIHSYAVTNLLTGGKYRFRIAAVYSNNDNKSGPISETFVLLKDPPTEKPSMGPFIRYAEAASPSAITLHWEYEDMDSLPINGFFIHYRAAHTAGKYLKVTVLGANTRSHIISHLLPDTGYEIKMQSFNNAGTSDFSNIYTTKTKVAEVVTGSKNRNSKSHHLDDLEVLVTEPVSSDSENNFTLHIILGAVCGVLIVVMLVCIVLCCRQKLTRQQNCDSNIVRDDPQKLANGHISANGYIPVNKINISVNPLSTLENDEGEKPEDLEDIVSNNNEIIRLRTFSLNSEPQEESPSDSEVNETAFNEDGKAASVIVPGDSKRCVELPENI